MSQTWHDSGGVFIWCLCCQPPSAPSDWPTLPSWVWRAHQMKPASKNSLLHRTASRCREREICHFNEPERDVSDVRRCRIQLLVCSQCKHKHWTHLKKKVYIMLVLKWRTSARGFQFKGEFSEVDLVNWPLWGLPDSPEEPYKHKARYSF